MIYLGNDDIHDMNDEQIREFIRKVEKGLISQIIDIKGDYILFIENDPPHNGKFLIRKDEFSEKEDLKCFKLKE